MTQPHESRLVTALLVQTMTTGLIDAVSYLALGRVFTANMTGNVVFLAFAIAGAPGLSIPRSVVSLGAFLAGAVAGGRLAARLGTGPQHRWIATAFGVEAVLLLSAALAGGASPRAWRRGASVLSMFLGAAVGALLVRHSLALPLVVSGVVAGGCAIAVARTP